MTCVTSPVGSPPLKILAGLTCPNPWPCAKSPVSWPSVGTAGGDDGGVVGPVVGPVVLRGGNMQWSVAAGIGLIHSTAALRLYSPT